MLRFSAQGVAVVAGADVALQVLDVRGGAIGKEPLARAGAVCGRDRDRERGKRGQVRHLRQVLTSACRSWTSGVVPSERNHWQGRVRSADATGTGKGARGGR